MKKIKTLVILSLVLSMLIPNIVYAADYSNLETRIHGAFESFQKLNNPTLKYKIDGVSAVLTWDKIPGANQYRINIDGKEKTITKNKWSYRMSEGDVITFNVRSEDNTGTYSPSDYSSVTIELPYIAPYGQLLAHAAADKTSLKKYLSNNNLTYKELEDTNYTIIHVFIKDAYNEKGAYKFGRWLAGGTVGIIEGTMEGFDSITTKSVLSDALANYAETESGKQTIVDTAKDTATGVIKSGLKSAGLNSIAYIAQDTDIHFLYYFNKNNKSNMCEKLIANLEYSCHENYKSMFDDDLKQTSDGIHYTYVDNGNVMLIIDINQVDNGTVYPKWYTVVIPVKTTSK
ncbi:MAG: hypothetical protein E7298_07005 [Lachnospiraceae bacterium]|nr:hypothetical protein [Lachnospiraceae bacterium]